MNRTQKEQLASSLKEKFASASVAFFADYKGLSATQADNLRKTLRPLGVTVKVLKNNVARQIAKDGALGEGAKSIMNDLVGPTLVGFSTGDIAAAAKVFKKFSEENEALVLKDSLMGKDRINASDIVALANLPSREVLLSKLLSVLNGPARGFVSVLNAVPRDFVGVLAALERKKSAG